MGESKSNGGRSDVCTPQKTKQAKCTVSPICTRRGNAGQGRGALLLTCRPGSLLAFVSRRSQAIWGALVRWAEDKEPCTLQHQASCLLLPTGNLPFRLWRMKGHVQCAFPPEQISEPTHTPDLRSHGSLPTYSYLVSIEGQPNQNLPILPA